MDVGSGDLEQLMRNKGLQARYDGWMMGQKQKYGSTGEQLLYLSSWSSYAVISMVRHDHDEDTEKYREVDEANGWLT